MSLDVKKAAVLGAGTMGSRIAAHLANAGVETLLLDLPAPGAEKPAERNAIVQKALKALGKSKPPAFFTDQTAKRLQIGNFEDDLAKIVDADWIVEAIIEKIEPKVELLAKVDQLRKDGSIVSSNTSGLPIAKLAEGRSADFRKHWLGTHFFNPPRHMRLLELIPTPETDPDVAAQIADFCDRRLGKAVVEAHDRPNFIANRIFLFLLMQTLHAMRENGLTIEEVDALTGTLVGRPRMATFRLADFTGVDVCVYVAGNLYELVPEDEKRDLFAPPDYLKGMLEKGLLGDKAGQGFYKKDRQAPGGRLVLDLDTLEYRERREPEIEGLDEIKKLPTVAERLRAITATDAPAGKFLWEVMSELFLYSAARVPEVCDDILAVDAVMTAGFNWKQGVFEIWNEWGVEETCERMQAEGKALPPLVEKVLASGSKAFYAEAAGEPTYFDLKAGGQKAVPATPGVLELSRVKLGGEPVRSNASASLWDLGDGVALLEFHSKANSLDAGVFELLATAPKVVEAHFDALVIGNQGENFSVGANLMLILGLAMEKRWDELDQQIRSLQATVRALRSSPKPVVAAVFGQTLAGGCEIALRCDHVQAAGETWMGLVECGVGLIPAAGGCAEMIRRHGAGLDETGDITSATRDVFEKIGLAKVSNSAEEAQQWRYLKASDDITMNRDRLLAEAKRAALALVTAGYEPPEEKEILVGGRGVRAALELQLWMMRQAMYASDHDVLVGKRLANVLAGGDLTQPSFVSEDYLLNLEREAFLSLAGEEKTQQRIQAILKTGRPLRN